MLRGLTSLGRVVMMVFIVVAVWSGIIRILDIDPFFMPGPAATLEAIVDGRSDLFSAALITFKAAAFGLLVSAVFASILAALVVRSAAIERTLLPLAIVLRTIPVIALAPLITLIIGRGFKTSVVAVVIVTFFPIFAYLAEGLRAVTQEMEELMRLYDASYLQSLRMVRVWVALPFLFAGLQTGARAAVLAAMLAEWLTGVNGLGRELVRAASNSRSDEVWAVVVVTTLLSLAFFFGTRALERRVKRRSVL